MLGFVVGSVCLIALIKMFRRGRHCGHGHHGWRHQHGSGGHGCGGHHHQQHGWSGGYEGDHGFDDGFDDDDGDRNRVVFLRSLFSQLQATPGQERIIVDGLKELKGAFQKAKSAQRKSAHDLSEALRSDTLSMDAMGSVFAALDEGTDAVRNGAFSALTKIHEVLDERQRRVLSDLIARGGGLQDLADAA